MINIDNQFNMINKLGVHANDKHEYSNFDNRVVMFHNLKHIDFM